MARPLRLEFPGAIYHVTARGNARNAIFIGDEQAKGQQAKGQVYQYSKLPVIFLLSCPAPFE